MRVREWTNNDLRAREIMQQISRMLNSNEQFQLDDTFSLHISHIRDPGRGSGKQRLRKASSALDILLDLKKSVIKINNEDKLCCARALVTMQAYCDLGSRHPEYVNLRRGKPAQERRAKELHRAAGVPEGPCRLPEIDTFQRHLTDHQIVILSLDHNYQIIFKGPIREKQIVLIKVGEHYHGRNSLSAYLGKSNFCIECEKSYQTNDISHHPCNGKKCPACCQTQCEDHRRARDTTHTCNRCHRSFFGEQCLENHYAYSKIDGTKADATKKNQKSMQLPTQVSSLQQITQTSRD